MKPSILKHTAILLLLAGSFSSCKDSNTTYGVPLEQLELAPKVNVPKKNIPEWLVVRINEYENEYSTLPFFSVIQIYKEEWKKRTVYYIRNNYASSLYQEIFNENGDNIRAGMTNLIIFVLQVKTG